MYRTKSSAVPSSTASQLGDTMDQEAVETGILLRIERASIHDGQGLRTVLFLKGCPLRCAWCSTPESQKSAPERGYLRRLCTACKKCIQTCPSEALSLSADESEIILDPARCKQCFNCVAICPSRANIRYGYSASVEETVQEIAKDEIFYFHSQGGITLSGGEPLAQSDFVSALLKKSKRLGIDTAIETSLYLDYKMIVKALPWLDVLYVDIKHMDSREHARWTGAGNELILENIRKTDSSEFAVEMVVRIPLIPGINDTLQNLKETLEFCRTLQKIKGIELLPYHRLGIETYKYICRNYSCHTLMPQPADQIAEKIAYLKGQSSGIPIKIGSGF